MFCLGENAHIDGSNNKLPRGQSSFTSFKFAQWALTETEEMATKNDLNSLIRQLLDCVEDLPIASTHKKKTARIVVDWSQSISSPSVNRGESMTPTNGIDWLIQTILGDIRTEKLYKSSDDKQIIVFVKESNGDIQYEYSSYLVDSINKNGYFTCDVIVMGLDDAALFEHCGNDFIEVSSGRK